MMHLLTIQRLLLLVLPAVALDLAKLAPGRRIRGLMVGSHEDYSKKVPVHSSKSMKGSKSKGTPKGPKGSTSKKGKGSGSKSDGASKRLKGSHSKGSSKVQVGSGQAGGDDHDHGTGGSSAVSSSKSPVISEPTDDVSGGSSGGDSGGSGGDSGGSGGDSGGSGGDSDGASSCQIIPVTFYRSDIPTYYKEGTIVEGIQVGGLNSMPFYSTNSGDQLGTYSDAGVRYGTLLEDECVVTGAFNFFPFVNDTKSADQVNVAFTCRGTTNSITGGTGKFQGATGYEEFVTVNATIVQAKLVVCMCCGTGHDGSSTS